MIGRVAYALALGILLGVIIAGAAVYVTAQRGTTPAPSRGDLNAPYSLALTVTEAFLAAQINNPPDPAPDEPAAERPKLHNAEVRLLADGTIQVRGEMMVQGVAVPVQAVLMPRVIDSRIQMVVVSGRAGGIGIPAAIATDVEQAVNRRLQAVLAQRAIAVVALEPGEGILKIRLK
ncbi:MAG TPA: hypothetical protein VIL85_07485 [Thermomicrobiales bacterium]|jgi:hypothetical protein